MWKNDVMEMMDGTKDMSIDALMTMSEYAQPEKKEEMIAWDEYTSELRIA